MTKIFVILIFVFFISLLQIEGVVDKQQGIMISLIISYPLMLFIEWNFSKVHQPDVSLE